MMDAIRWESSWAVGVSSDWRVFCKPVKIVRLGSVVEKESKQHVKELLRRAELKVLGLEN